jgi:hypothetical protein
MYEYLAWELVKKLESHISTQVCGSFKYKSYRIKNNIISWKVEVRLEPENKIVSGSISLAELHKLL